jgi:hypothetical protein
MDHKKLIDLQVKELTIKNFKNKQGLYLQIIPFYNCAVKCDYCFTFNKLNSEIKISVMDLKKYLTIINEETKHMKFVYLSLLGGELTESVDFYKYMDVVYEVFEYRKETISIEFLSNLNGSIKQYNYFFDKFSNFAYSIGLFTIHNNAVKNEKILNSFINKLTIFDNENRYFDITFLEQNNKEDYMKYNLKIRNTILNKNIKLKKYFEILPVLGYSVSPNLKCGVDINKHKPNTKKVLCHANYLCLRPEGITHECGNKNYKFEELIKNGLKNILKSMICTINECPCFSDLRDIVGYIDLKKGKK